MTLRVEYNTTDNTTYIYNTSPNIAHFITRDGGIVRLNSGAVHFIRGHVVRDDINADMELDFVGAPDPVLAEAEVAPIRIARPRRINAMELTWNDYTVTTTTTDITGIATFPVTTPYEEPVFNPNGDGDFSIFNKRAEELASENSKR